MIPKDEVDRLPHNLLHLFQGADDLRTFANVAADGKGIRPFGHSLYELPSLIVIEEIQLDVGKPRQSHRLF